MKNYEQYLSILFSVWDGNLSSTGKAVMSVLERILSSRLGFRVHFGLKHHYWIKSQCSWGLNLWTPCSAIVLLGPFYESKASTPCTRHLHLPESSQTGRGTVWRTYEWRHLFTPVHFGPRWPNDEMENGIVLSHLSCFFICSCPVQSSSAIAIGAPTAYFLTAELPMQCRTQSN